MFTVVCCWLQVWLGDDGAENKGKAVHLVRLSVYCPETARKTQEKTLVYTQSVFRVVLPSNVGI